MVLDEGVKAPFNGVLVNPTNYREFSIDHLENKECQENLKDLAKCNPIEMPKILTFQTGIIAGFLTAMILSFKR